MVLTHRGLCVIERDNIERGERLSGSLGKLQELGIPFGNKTGEDW